MTKYTDEDRREETASEVVLLGVHPGKKPQTDHVHITGSLHFSRRGHKKVPVRYRPNAVSIGGAVGMILSFADME